METFRLLFAHKIIKIQLEYLNQPASSKVKISHPTEIRDIYILNMKCLAQNFPEHEFYRGSKLVEVNWSILCTPILDSDSSLYPNSIHF